MATTIVGRTEVRKRHFRVAALLTLTLAGAAAGGAALVQTMTSGRVESTGFSLSSADGAQQLRALNLDEVAGAVATTVDVRALNEFAPATLSLGAIQGLRAINQEPPARGHVEKIAAARALNQPEAQAHGSHVGSAMAVRALNG